MEVDMEATVSGFARFGFNKQIQEALNAAGMLQPTDIQQKTLPSSLSGQDILGIAQTGTGKTAAYLIPLIYHLKYNQTIGPRALILVPARELAIQVLDHFKALAQYTNLKAVALYGGIGPKLQKEQLAQPIDLLIATPGRLMELYHSGELTLKKLKHLVIDEADRMMDMGFMPQIRRLLEVIPVKRQNMLFSATFPENVAKLSEEFLEFPVRVEVSPQATVKESVYHALYIVPNFMTKLELTKHLISALGEDEAAMIFVRSKGIAKQVSDYLTQHTPVTVRALHGNIGQNTRLNVVKGLRDKTVKVAVATDVAARGHDINHIELVINFDVPLLYEDYVHRIGRTGRMHKKGTAYTFATDADLYHIAKIEQLIRHKIERLPMPEGVFVHPTSFEEKQNILRQIDAQRKKEDPSFKGAFHEKKVTMPIKKDSRRIKSKKPGHRS
jgi:ATP-dependent RNA helicase RhlE